MGEGCDTIRRGQRRGRHSLTAILDGMKLRHAASTTFALTAVLPFLVFVYFMWRLDVMRSIELQMGLLLALLVALLGFVLFCHVIQRITDLSSALGQAAPAPPADGTSQPAAIIVPGRGQVSETGEIAQESSRMLAALRGSTDRLEDLVFKLGTLNDMVEMAAKIPKVKDLLSHVLARQPS